jgi:hypothetical protein
MGRWFEASSLSDSGSPDILHLDATPNSAASLPHNSLLRSWHTDFDLKATAHTGRTQGGAAGPASAPCPPGARRSTHRDQGGSHGTQTACYARQLFSLPLSSSRSCRNGTQGVTLRSAYATNDSGTAPAIMAAARKVAKIGTAAASYSRWRLPDQTPPHTGHGWPVPSMRRAEPAFHETRGATCRRSTRQLRGGLPQAEPGITLAADSHAASRASGIARQMPQITIGHPGMTAVRPGVILRTLIIG